MRTLTLSLFAAAFVLAAPVATAQTGTFCFDGNAGGQFFFTLTVDNNATDLIVGTADVGSTAGLWTSVGGRGQSNSTIRHHVLTQINPSAGDVGGCTGSDGLVDWFVYNGSLSGNSFPYAYTGDWVNACGSTGIFDGFITPGACPTALQGESGPDAATSGVPGALEVD